MLYMNTANATDKDKQMGFEAEAREVAGADVGENFKEDNYEKIISIKNYSCYLSGDIRLLSRAGL